MILALKKSPDGSLEGLAKPSEDRTDFARIRCPLCHWQPKPRSRWYCTDMGHPEYFWAGCGTAWNTFQTGGLCPGCGHQWRYTACLRCGRISLHQDWYIKNPAGT